MNTFHRNQNFEKRRNIKLWRQNRSKTFQLEFVFVVVFSALIQVLLRVKGDPNCLVVR